MELLKKLHLRKRHFNYINTTYIKKHCNPEKNQFIPRKLSCLYVRIKTHIYPQIQMHLFRLFEERMQSHMKNNFSSINIEKNGRLWNLQEITKKSAICAVTKSNL